MSYNWRKPLRPRSGTGATTSSEGQASSKLYLAKTQSVNSHLYETEGSPRNADGCVKEVEEHGRCLHGGVLGYGLLWSYCGVSNMFIERIYCDWKRP